MGGGSVGDTVVAYCEDCGWARECDYTDAPYLMLAHGVETGHHRTFREPVAESDRAAAR